VIVSSDLVNYVGESIVANERYGISVHVQRKSSRNLIQDNAVMIEILTGMNLILTRNAFCKAIFHVVDDGYGYLPKKSRL
jgi:TPP-dependent pyruvate/acetoin dehydrogenase alpha subunit